MFLVSMNNFGVKVIKNEHLFIVVTVLPATDDNFTVLPIFDCKIAHENE